MLTGTCLCKAISSQVNGELEHPPEACHCQQCRKQSGGFMMGVNILNSALMIRGEDKVTCYESSREVDVGFAGFVAPYCFGSQNSRVTTG